MKQILDYCEDSFCDEDSDYDYKDEYEFGFYEENTFAENSPLFPRE